jgi:hypothetical protein
VFTNSAGEENGNRGAPLRVGKGNFFCNGKFNINQDLTTNTTTLIIKKKHLYMVNGSATMEHILDLTA